MRTYWYRSPQGTIGTIITSLLAFLFFLIFSIAIPFIGIKLLINGEDIFFAICCLILCPYFISLTVGMFEGLKEEIEVYKEKKK